MSSTHTPGEETPDDDEIFPFIVDADTDRGQHIFCQNLLVNLFEPGISPCKTEFPDVKIKRQIIDHYLKDICNITQQYGIYSIEFTSPNHNNRKYTIQTDDLDLEFSKVFSEYIKSIQYHNSQRANSIFTNEVFAIIYSYISILENELPLTNVSPTETSKHLRVRHEITLLSSYLNIIKENFTKDDVSQHTKHDLQKILAWFIIDYFTHNIDLIAQARKNFRPQNSNDDTAITEQSDYVWDPEWSHPAFISFPQSISSQAIGTISYIRDYVREIPLTIDATPLNYNTFLPDTQNNSLNSTVIHNENLNGTRNLTQQDIQTPSHFINEEIVHTTTTQQSISPIRPNLTTPRNTNPSQTQVTLQSTVKPSVAPKYSHMDYQTYRPMTIPSKTRKTFTRNNFTDHNYNYTHPSKTYNHLDPVIRQLKSWHKYKTKPIKADSTILGNKTLLRYFRKFNNTTINENTDLLEYNLNESTVPCLPLSMILIAFNISHTQNIKGHSGSEKTYSNFIQNFYFPNAPIWIKVLCNDCIVCQLNKPYPNQKQIAQKQDFKGQSLYFNHRISFDTKGPISPSSEGNSYIMVIVDAFTHYVALNPVPHCNAYYAYTTLYEHWIAKFGLPEILVTDNGTEFINNEIITLCHLYNIKHKPRTSHAPWTNGLVEGMNRSLQEYLRCIINGNDTKYTEWSADVKLFPLAYNSQITTTLGMSPYEMVFNQKPRKPIMFTANSHKNAQGYCQPNKDSICYNLPLHTHDEDHFHHPQILKLASGTHTEWILNRDKKHNEIYQKITKKLLQRQNINEQINSRFTPASELKIGTFVLIPNFNTQKGISKKLQPLRKGPYQIIAKPTDVTYKITDSNKKEIVQHRNNLLPYYPKEYALRELTQLYSFTGLKIIQNEPHLKNTEQNDNPTENQNTKPTTTKNNTQNHKESPKQRKNRKMTEQIIPQEQIDKSENRKTTRLRNQPRKNYKIFIPQSKILKKVEFQK